MRTTPQCPEDQPHGLSLSERDARATERNYDVPTPRQDLMSTSAANWRHFAPAQEAPTGHTTTGFESDVAAAVPSMSVTALAGQRYSVHSTMSGIGLSTYDRLSRIGFSDLHQLCRYNLLEPRLPPAAAGLCSPRGTTTATL
jgi:hypothetical protein